LSTGNAVSINSQDLNFTAINGQWVVTVIDSTNFTLNLSTYSSGWSGGGLVDNANRIMIAVSSSSTITSTSNFTFYQFGQDQPPAGTNSPGSSTMDNGYFADYPSLGVDNNALYVGVNIFDDTQSPPAYKGATGFVINKASVLQGPTATVTAFRRIGNNSNNVFTPLGVTNMDSSATQGYFIGADTSNLGLLKMRRIFNPGSTPSVSGVISIGDPLSTAEPLSVPAHGGTRNIDAIDYRLMNAQIINGSLWTAHSIQVDQTGAGGGAIGTQRDGMRFYQINSLTGTPAVVQSGTLYDPSVTANPLYYWMGSIAATGQGHAVLASSFAGSKDYEGAAFDMGISSFWD
jgi:hypothetical protein